MKLPIININKDLKLYQETEFETIPEMIERLLYLCEDHGNQAWLPVTDYKETNAGKYGTVLTELMEPRDQIINSMNSDFRLIEVEQKSLSIKWLGRKKKHAICNGGADVSESELKMRAYRKARNLLEIYYSEQRGKEVHTVFGEEIISSTPSFFCRIDHAILYTNIVPFDEFCKWIKFGVKSKSQGTNEITFIDIDKCYKNKEVVYERD